MLGLPPVQGPRAVLSDLRAFLGRRSPEKTKAALLSVGITASLVGLFFLDLKVRTAPPPTVAYAESWSLDRTDAEIKADQKVSQKEAEEKALARQREFQEIANTFGIE